MIGITAIVASLLLLAMEVRQNRQIGRSEISLALLQSPNQHHELISANADVWFSGCRGDEPNDTERTRFAKLFGSYSQRVYFARLNSQDSILGPRRVTPVDLDARTNHRYPGFAAMIRIQRQRKVQTCRPSTNGTEPRVRLGPLRPLTMTGCERKVTSTSWVCRQ